MTDFICYLKQNFTSGLPGFDTQSIMMPKTDIPVHGPGHIHNYQNSAVMCLLTGKDRINPNVVLTIRSEDLNFHGGQISFPGGKCDKNESFKDTAIRETAEEIGVVVKPDEIIRELSGFSMHHRNIYIQPLTAYKQKIDHFNVNHKEVNEVFTINLNDLLSKELFTIEEWNLNGTLYSVPLWKVHSKVPLWGATAMMLSEVVELYRRFKSEYQLT